MLHRPRLEMRGMRVSASFQIIPRPLGRLGLGLRSGSHVVGRLGSGPPVKWDGKGQEYGLVPVFIFSLQQPWGCPWWEGKLSGAVNVRGGGICPRGNVLHSRQRRDADWTILKTQNVAYSGPDDNRLWNYYCYTKMKSIETQPPISVHAFSKTHSANGS